MSKKLRELKQQLSLCHQHAASLLKESRSGQWDSNQAAMQAIEQQIQQKASARTVDINKG